MLKRNELKRIYVEMGVMEALGDAFGIVRLVALVRYSAVSFSRLELSGNIEREVSCSSLFLSISISSICATYLLNYASS